LIEDGFLPITLQGHIASSKDLNFFETNEDDGEMPKVFREIKHFTNAINHSCDC